MLFVFSSNITENFTVLRQCGLKKKVISGDQLGVGSPDEKTRDSFCSIWWLQLKQRKIWDSQDGKSLIYQQERLMLYHHIDNIICEARKWL